MNERAEEPRTKKKPGSTRINGFLAVWFLRRKPRRRREIWSSDGKPKNIEKQVVGGLFLRRYGQSISIYAKREREREIEKKKKRDCKIEVKLIVELLFAGETHLATSKGFCQTNHLLQNHPRKDRSSLSLPASRCPSFFSHHVCQSLSVSRHL